MYVDICIYFLLDCEFPLNIHSNTAKAAHQFLTKSHTFTAKVFCIHNK